MSKDNTRNQVRPSVLSAASALTSLGGGPNESSDKKECEKTRKEDDSELSTEVAGNDHRNVNLVGAATDKKPENTTSPQEGTEGNLQDSDKDDVPSSKGESRSDRGDDIPMTFPQRLMEILSEDANKEIISWLPHGRGFIISQKKRFANEVMPRYFKQSKFTSFTRKLNRWGFTRVSRGAETGAYFHPYFKRGDLRLCLQMCCQSVKQPSVAHHSPALSPHGNLGMNGAMEQLRLGHDDNLVVGSNFGGNLPFRTQQLPSPIEDPTSNALAELRRLQLQQQQQQQYLMLQRHQQNLNMMPNLNPNHHVPQQQFNSSPALRHLPQGPHFLDNLTQRSPQPHPTTIDPTNVSPPLMEPHNKQNPVSTNNSSTFPTSSAMGNSGEPEAQSISSNGPSSASYSQAVVGAAVEALRISNNTNPYLNMLVNQGKPPVAESASANTTGFQQQLEAMIQAQQQQLDDLASRQKIEGGKVSKDMSPVVPATLRLNQQQNKHKNGGFEEERSGESQKGPNGAKRASAA